jgi:hypothetical protein
MPDGHTCCLESFIREWELGTVREDEGKAQPSEIKVSTHPKVANQFDDVCEISLRIFEGCSIIT